jgi:hypothetical protein
VDLPGSCAGAPHPAGLPRPLGAGAGATALGRAWPTGRARRAHQQRRAGHGGGAYARVDAHHGRQGDDCAYSVVTVREGRIVALRDCHDRQEALQLAGSSGEQPRRTSTSASARTPAATPRKPCRCPGPVAAGGPGRPRPGSDGHSGPAMTRAGPPVRDNALVQPRRDGRPSGSSGRVTVRRRGRVGRSEYGSRLPGGVRRPERCPLFVERWPVVAHGCAGQR